MNKIFNIMITSLLCLSVMGAHALTPSSQQRALKLFEEVRCPTCVAQSIKDSQTIASTQLRNYIINRINEGLSDDQILESIRQYYGDDITYTPPMNGYTIFLWMVPLSFLAVAIFKLIKRGLIKN